MIRKVKILKKPKFDLTKLMELYKDKPEEEKTKATENAIKEWSNLLLTVYTRLKLDARIWSYHDFNKYIMSI